ncbi:MAG: hypothetical protein ACKKMW_02285 [Candidatus Nealsonbacteria bacterium]
MDSYTKEIIVAYFKGGNAQDSGVERIKQVLKVIKEVVEEEEEERE